jgi:hypothetical protein
LLSFGFVLAGQVLQMQIHTITCVTYLRLAIRGAASEIIGWAQVLTTASHHALSRCFTSIFIS